MVKRKPNQTYRFHFLGQFHRIHRVLEQKKEDTTQKMWMLPQLHVAAAAGWFGYGDSIGIATGDFHLMYIDENQQKIKRKKRELPMISVFRTFTLCLRMVVQRRGGGGECMARKGESVESVKSLSSYKK